ncbi:sugar phosphate nucleotidyltransferase, partial [Inquilinus sp. YAF38]|uniref:sugar phosphate nucleotidyltransferase n=1 Tax=Inquilinus sp. YAF38 TaxID=3233084 RepID=UPI003F927CE6
MTKARTVERPAAATEPGSQLVVPVVLSGGSGTRLWPLSRAGYPKQFLPLVSDSTMIQETVSRVGEADGFAPPVFICADDHRF